MRTLLIKNGTVVTHDGIKQADILVKDGKITSISPNISENSNQTIDAKKLLVMPGGVDVHTHMELPAGDIFSSDTFETGTLAALHGGTTTIIDFANQTKGQSLKKAFSRWQERANGKTYTDYGLHIAVTDVNDNTLREMDEFFSGEGVTSFKTFLAYEHNKINLENLRMVMKKAKELGGIVSLHAEDGGILEKKLCEFQKTGKTSPEYHYLAHPEIAEEKATAEAIDLAIKEDCPLYIVHLTSKKALDHIISAQKNGAKIFAETCPHYLVLNKEKYYNPDHLEAAKFIMSPPLRCDEDREALWEGIFNGHIQVIGTDHCPFTLSQKKKNLSEFWKIPNGIPGVENRMELFFHEAVNRRGLSLTEFVKLCSQNPAKIFGLENIKGHIAPGFDADIILFDPNEEHILSSKTHHMNVDYSPYEGMKIKGRCKKVIFKGKVVIDDNKSLISHPEGIYLKRT